MQQPTIEEEQKQITKKLSLIQNIIMVMSNKGGVGKSTVSANLAEQLALQGFKTALLDIDIHGPSQDKLFGLTDPKVKVNQDKLMEPIIINKNLKLITIAGMIENENNALIWRGPLKISIMKQFLVDVNWGELDFLIIDAPPGTGDEPLSIAQFVEKLAGVIIVTTPSPLALPDTRKAINFATKLDLNILGIVENMSGMICPHCHQEIYLDKTVSINDHDEYQILGSIPMNHALFDNPEVTSSEADFKKYFGYFIRVSI